MYKEQKDPEGSAMDNFGISLVSRGRKHFDMAFKIAFGAYKTGAVAYRKGKTEEGVSTLTFCWVSSDSTSDLPITYNAQMASDLAWEWLSEEVAYPKGPDVPTFVNCSKGYCIIAGLANTHQEGWDILTVLGGAS